MRRRGFDQRRRSRARLLPLLALLASGAPPVAGETLGSRDAAQLTVLHLADVYEMAPVSGGRFGGLARVAALERRLVGEKSHVIVTLGGDFLSPSVASSVFEGEQMIAALGAMGLDLATLGNHEFDFGPEVLRRRMREAPWDWVVSNVVDEATGKPFGGASPWLVRQYGDLGAVEVSGNVGTPFVGIDNTAAEWNFYLDPHAAQQVLASGVAIRLMPLDATGALPITPEFVDRVRGQPRDQTSELLLSLLEAVHKGIDAGWYYFWDVLAAVATARPEVLACRDETIEVVTREGPQLGRTRPSAAGARVCVVEQINRQAFEDDLLKAILD